MGEGGTEIRREELNTLLLSMRRDGHVRSWERVYEMLFPFASAMACHRGLDVWMREDVVHESFVRLRQVCTRYEPTADGLSFYAGILRNVIREHLAMQRRRRASCREIGERRLREIPAEPEKGSLPAGLSGQDAPLIAEDALLVALAKLSPLLAQAIELRVVNGLRCEQAAGKAQCSVAAMRKRTSRAILALRREITGRP